MPVNFLPDPRRLLRVELEVLARNELRGRTVSTPALEDRGVGPVLITLPSTRCTPPVVEQLKEVLRTHPGATEVRLRLVTRGATRVLRLDDRLRVSPSPALYGDLKQLLGPGCLG